MNSPIAPSSFLHWRIIQLVAIRVVLLAIPVALLTTTAYRVSGWNFGVLWCGAIAQAMICVLCLRPSCLRVGAASTYILHYLLALAWLWIGAGQEQHWFPYVVQAVLLIVPLGVLAGQTLHATGASTLRRAQHLAEALAAQDSWPDDLSMCRTWPQIRAFRELLHFEAAPALELLKHPCWQVRFAALTALEFHKHWRPGEPEQILRAAGQAEEDEVRAAAVLALANVEDRYLVETVANFLADPAPRVRRAATEAILWDLEKRWTWIRHALKRALTRPATSDGALDPFAHHMLPTAAVDDLIAWCAEKGELAPRAAAVLANYYGERLDSDKEEDLAKKIGRAVASSALPQPLRTELARMLHAKHRLDPAVALRLLDGGNPAPLRLLAVEALAQGGDLTTLRAALVDLARIPNRELALATAKVVQRYLAVDLGLSLSDELPPLNSRRACDALVRLRNWAERPEQADLQPVE